MKRIRLILYALFIIICFIAFGCEKNNTLGIPTNCFIDNYEILHWDKVPYATNYRVTMRCSNETFEYTTKTNELDIFNITDKVGKYIFNISAYTYDNSIIESSYSKDIIFNINSYDEYFSVSHNILFFNKINLIQGKLIIPETINDIDIEKINFQSNMVITSVIIPDGVNSIQPLENAEKLTRVKLPYNLEVCGNQMFKNCPLIKEIYLPNNVKKIGTECFFNNCSLEKIVIGENVNHISDSAFSGCFNLKEVNISNNNYLYYDNGLFINKDNNYIMSATEYFKFNDYVKGIYRGAFNCLHVDEIIIPDNIVYIENQAFNNLPYLKRIDFGNGVTILDNVITNCPLLEEVIISENISNITNGTFGFNPVLSTISISKGNEYYSYNNGCLIDKRTNLLVRLLGDFVIPEDIKVISQYVGIGYCNDKLIIPNHIEKIEQFAFSESLYEKLILGDNVKEINRGAFSGNRNLKKIRLNEGLEIIGSSAFSNCYYIEGVTIPRSVKEIESNAFIRCFTSIILYDTIEKVEKDAFLGCCLYYEGEYSSKIKGSFAIFTDCTINNGYLVSWTYKVNDKYGTPNAFFSIDTDKYNNNFPEIPYREGYKFLGFSYSKDSIIPDICVEKFEKKYFVGTDIEKICYYVITSDLLKTLESGTTLYCVWKKID